MKETWDYYDRLLRLTNLFKISLRALLLKRRIRYFERELQTWEEQFEGLIDRYFLADFHGD